MKHNQEDVIMMLCSMHVEQIKINEVFDTELKRLLYGSTNAIRFLIKIETQTFERLTRIRCN